jgi:hypothetical protein
MSRKRLPLFLLGMLNCSSQVIDIQKFMAIHLMEKCKKSGTITATSKRAMKES